MTLTNGHLSDVELSPRELEVLTSVAGFYTTTEIGELLHITPNTVKCHLKAINQKLAVNTRGQAVRRARALDLM